MEKQGLWPAILRFVRNIGITIVCMFVLAGLSCLPAAWRTFYHLGNRVMLLGVLVLVLGVGSPAVNPKVAGNLQHLMPTGNPLTERRLTITIQSFRFTIAMGIAGGVAVFLGNLIRRAGLSVLGLP